MEQRGCLSVNYPTLKESPYHALAKSQFGGRGGGAILTVRVGIEDAKDLIEDFTAAITTVVK